MNKIIINKTTALASELTTKVCSSYFCRLKGLMFSKPLIASKSLLLSMPTESIFMSGIHMVAVTYNIGAVWINSENKVVDIQLAKKWVSVLTPIKPAKYVLEIHPNRMVEFNLNDEIYFENIN